MLKLNDVLKIGQYEFRVVKIKDNFALMSWVEQKTGVDRTYWVKIKP